MAIRKRNRRGLNAAEQEWKPLKLNQAILCSGIEGLIGIEELVDYKPGIFQTVPNLNADLSAAPKVKSKVKTSQRKIAVSPHSSKNTLASNLSKSKKGKHLDLGSGEPLDVSNKLVKTLKQVQKNDVNKSKAKYSKKSKPSKCENKNNQSGKPKTINKSLESEKLDMAIPSELGLHAPPKSGKPKTINTFLESEKLEMPIPSGLGLHALSKVKKGRKNKNSQEVETSIETDLTKVLQSPLKSKKRTLSQTETLASELPLKKKKKRSKQKKMKKVDPSDADAENNTSHTKLKTKKQARSSSVDVKRKKKSKLKGKTAVTKEADEEFRGPVTGMEAWSGLNLPESILRALAEKGFKTPTGIQALSLPAAILGRRDIMGAAETGSGKTLAFGIPIIYGILQQKKKEARLKDSDKGDGAECDAISTEPEKETANGDAENEDSPSLGEGTDGEAETTEVEEKENGDGGSGDETESIGVDAEGIGCVKVIDDFDMDEVLGIRTDRPHNPAHNWRLYALVLTPTRELAVQVREHLRAAAKYTGIRVALVIGGLAPQKQERLLRTAPEIVVATPGRLWELIQEGNPHLQQVDDISFLAIDETDRMLERDHFRELQELLERINANEDKTRGRQNFVFSATLTMVHEPPHRKKTKGNRKKKQMKVTPGQKLQDVVRMLGITNPKLVDVTQESGTSGTLEEAQISCTFDEKDFYLYYFLVKHPGRTLIFCNSISCVRRLAQILTILRCKPLPIHANMIQRQRLRNLDKFRDNPTGLLLATDVAARGLDVPNVQHVIHYQVPRTSEGYIHRSGRTARASKEGLTLLLVEPEEQRSYARLCRTLGRQQQLPNFPISQDLFVAAKQRVMLARDVDQLELTSRRADSEMGWFQKAMTEMDIVLDDDELPMRISKKDSAGNRKAANAKRKQLDSLLSRPLFSVRM